MASRTLKFNSFIPSINSVVKSDSKSKNTSRTVSKFRGNNMVGFFSAIAAVTLVLSLSFYVYMINAYASKGYELKKQQAVMKELNDTQKRLVVEQAALGSIVKVNDIAATSGMVPVTGEEFLTPNQLSSAR